MTTRLLPREEWERLDDTFLRDTWRKLPAEARVRVVEKGSEIVACTALFPVWHQEATWTAERERGNPAVGRHLLAGMKQDITALGLSEVWMMATTPETSALCQKFGTATRLDAEHFAVSVEG